MKDFLITNDLSKRIISIRFLLIILVVFIHNNPTEIYFSTKIQFFSIPTYVGIIVELISIIISGIAVPLLFLISGYLLYAKNEMFIIVLQKKIKTILLPYVIWNVLTVLLFFIAQSFDFTKPYFESNIIRDFRFIDWIDIFAGKFTALRHYQYPMVYQFWFLRDLFILNLLFVIIKKIINQCPCLVFFTFFILWISNLNIYIVSTEALLFFSLGYYIVKYSLDYKTLDKIKPYDVIAIYILTIIGELFFKDELMIIHKINIIIGSVLIIKLSLKFISNDSLFKKLAWLEKYAFFVFAIHGMVLAIIQKLSVLIIPMYNGWLLLQYFGVTIVGIIFSIILGMIIKKLFPRVYGLLTGGRS